MKSDRNGIKKIALLSGFLILTSVVIIFTVFLWGKLPDGKHVKMVFLPINNGDAIYLQTPHGKEVLWDGGDDLSVLRQLSEHRVFWDRHLDLWIISHPDSDHYYGGLEVLKRFDIDTIIVSGVVKGDPKYHQLFSLAEEKGSHIVIASDAVDIELDGVVIDTLFPRFVYGSAQSATNNSSLVQRVSFRGNSVLMTGDIEALSELEILQLGIGIEADVLKVPHHGSKSSSSEMFLKAVHPEMAIITAGTKNRFGHPHQEVLQRYTKMGIPYRNTQDGSVVLRW